MLLWFCVGWVSGVLSFGLCVHEDKEMTTTATFWYGVAAGAGFVLVAMYLVVFMSVFMRRTKR